MEIKLKSAFQNHKLRLAVKALIFAGFLVALQSGELGFWPVVLFLIGALAVYSLPLFRTFELIASFIILCADVLFIFSAFGTNGGIWLSLAYFSVLFYILLGIKELAFVKREVWKRVLALGLAYPVFVIFYYYAQAGTFLRLGLVFAGLLLLSKDVAVRRLPSWANSLLALEIAWAVSLLPIGFVSQAGLATLSYFILLDVSYYRYVENHFNKRVVMIHVTLLALLVMLVFAFSRWGI